MAAQADRRRFWSDGRGIYHIATFGERLFAGIAEWAIVIVVGLAASAIVSTVYGYITVGDPYAYYVYGDGEDDRVLLIAPMTCAFVTIIQIVSAFLVARFGASAGYHVMTLAVKRENAGRLGWRRCLVRKSISSPLLSVPLLTLAIWGVVGGAFGGFWSSAFGIVAIVIIAWIVVNHAWIRFDAQWRCLSDVLMGTVVVQNRILSTNREAFPSTGREPVERWD